MVDLIDKLATGNPAEQAITRRTGSSQANSAAGFRAVLQDVAAEPLADRKASDSLAPDSAMDAQYGNSLPSSDQNLPANPSEGEGLDEPLSGIGNPGEGAQQTSSAFSSDIEASSAALLGAEGHQHGIEVEGADEAVETVQSLLAQGDSGQGALRDQPGVATNIGSAVATSTHNSPDLSVHLQPSEIYRASSSDRLVELSGTPLTQPSPQRSTSDGLMEFGREPFSQFAYQSNGAPQQPQLSGELGELVKLIEGERPSALLPSHVRQLGLQNALAANAGASIQSPASSQLGQALTSMDVKSTASGSTDSMLSAKIIENIPIEKLALNAGSDFDAVSELHRTLLNRSDRPAVGAEITAFSNGTVGGVLPSVGSAPGANSSALADGIVRGTPVLAAGDPENFSASMATHLRVMKSGGISEARLQLNPAELGRLSIQIASQDSEVKVSFVVESQQAKQVIENAMPRLRELLDGAGLNLTDSGVDQRRQDTHDASPQESNQAAESDAFVNDSGEIALVVTVDPNRLVDAYA